MHDLTTKTPREVIAEADREWFHDLHNNTPRPDAILSALTSAGYVIVPREPHPRLTSLGQAYWQRAMELYDQDRAIGERSAG